MAGFKEITSGYPEIQAGDYKSLDGWDKKLKTAAAKLKNLNVIHVNATAFGGGVAEMQWSRIPLERSLGLKSRWLVIDNAPAEFFDVTKKIHNLIQGKAGMLTQQEKNLYLEVNKELAEELKKYCEKIPASIVVIHDPQPLAAIAHLPKNHIPILRLHIDLSTPNASTMEFLRPYICGYKNVIISHENYRPSLQWVKTPQLKIVYPAIDPFSEKNKPMDSKVAAGIMEEFEINPTKPIIAQVSRFDPWKDPLGVVETFYKAKNKIEDLQLVMAGFLFAKDDPESVSVFEKVKKYAKGDPAIHLFSDPKDLEDVSNDAFIGALYTASTVMIQKSIREGFGLTITEAMWKEKPVVAGLTSGSKIQIQNGKTGFLITSADEAAKMVVKLIKDPKLREKIGKAAHKSVQNKFILPRLVLDFLKIYNSALTSKVKQICSDAPANRPVSYKNKARQ